MATAIINIKTDSDLKAHAQAKAAKMGLTLSAILNESLKKFIKEKQIIFDFVEEPSEFLIKGLKESEEDLKYGRVVSFKNHDEVLKYLDKMIKDDGKHKKN